MKEDYLWDKTGEDAEIERLEKALMAFRYAETAPPELPGKVFVVEKEKPRKFWQFGFAFAAFATVALIFFTVWFLAAPAQLPVLESVAETNQPESTDRTIKKESVPPATPVQIIENRPRLNTPKVVKIRSTVAPKIRPIKLVARKTEPKEIPETLTAEEQYAYDQLMLALSITGSKLKIVKDKIDAIEGKTAVLDTAR